MPAVRDAAAVGARTTLVENVYDDALCDAPDPSDPFAPGSDACGWGPETTDRANGKLRTIRSYRDGHLLDARRNVYRGVNGRLSAVEQALDCAGVARPGEGADFDVYLTR